MANDKMIRSLARDLASLIAQIDQEALRKGEDAQQQNNTLQTDKTRHLKKTDKKD